MYYRIFDIHPKSCEYKIVLTFVAKILKSRVRRRAVSVQFLAKGCGFSTLVLSRTNLSQLSVGMVRHTIVGWKSYISICFCCRLYMLWLNFNVTNKFWVQLWYWCCCAYLRTDHETSIVKHNGNLVFASPGPTEAMQTHPLCHLIISVLAKKSCPE